MVIKNKNGWIRIIEAFLAVLLIMGVLLITINKDSPQETYSEEVHVQTNAILQEIEFNPNLREEIIDAVSLPINWDEFESNGLTNTKNKIIERTPTYLNCSAKLCEIGGNCNIDSQLDVNIYTSSVELFATSSTYAPRRLKLFCWDKEGTSGDGECTPDCEGKECGGDGCGDYCLPYEADCGSQATCSIEGSCECASGYGNCNDDFLDGCESDLSSDPNNCDICGNDCGVGGTCRGGVCQAPVPIVVLNSATGKNCDQICSENGGLSCINIGTNVEGTNGLFYYFLNYCRTTSSGSCTKVMLHQGATCSGKTTYWTNCECS